jgi:phospho-N-acetylmuramoyl-pentapeptide-transferase
LNQIATAFGIGAGISAILAYPIFRLLLAMRARQTVSQYVQEHAHKQGTPTMGGLIILAGFVGYLIATGARWELIAFTVAFAFIGFFDDYVIPRLFPGKRGLGWGQKLILQVLIAGGSMALFSTSPTVIAVGTFTLLYFSNAYNFADGLDWLAGTILFAYVAGLMFLVPAGSWRNDLAGLLGAAVPFMILNRPKAKLFMGDVGSMFVGAWLGLATMTLLGPAYQFGLRPGEAAGSVPALSFALAVIFVISLVLSIELIPVPLQILSVKLRGKRLFPPTPIHHAFQRAGWKETQIVALFFTVQLVCSGLAVALVAATGGFSVR